MIRVGLDIDCKCTMALCEPSLLNMWMTDLWVRLQAWKLSSHHQESWDGRECIAQHHQAMDPRSLFLQGIVCVVSQGTSLILPCTSRSASLISFSFASYCKKRKSPVTSHSENSIDENGTRSISRHDQRVAACVAVSCDSLRVMGTCDTDILHSLLG